jgi:hypothetical protein
MPSEDMFGVNNMNPKEYADSFTPWYDIEKTKENWNFKEELKRYCRADVELLSKAVLKYRKITTHLKYRRTKEINEIIIIL